MLAVRERLVSNPWAQIGADAIAWELGKLGVSPPPRRTLERGGAAQRPERTRRQAKGVPYPALAAERVSDGHEADLVGPRHLEGGVRFYALKSVDLASHRAGIEIVADSGDERVTDGLLALWTRLGLPRRVKFDNGCPFTGARRLGLVARFCLHHGVIPHFVPQGEPWPNGTVEHFNDTFDKRFFRQERFVSLAHLRERARSFETFHNDNHRYQASGGRTPSEAVSETTPGRKLPSRAQLPKVWPRQGRVEFVRFIPSDRKLRLLGRVITVPDPLVYQYLTALLDLAIPAGDSNLRVLREGEIAATANIAIGGR